MVPGARLQAAIEVLGEVFTSGRAASVVLADWARRHRFAGSADRGAIGNLVFDALRKRQSHAFFMGEGSPRAIAFSVLARDWHIAPDDIAALSEGPHAPEPLSADERRGLANTQLDAAPPWVQGDYPQWLHERFCAAFGEEAIAEGKALATRAPVDLRANTLKATPEKVLKALARFDPKRTPHSPVGIRLAPREGPARSPNVEADPGHAKGWFEIQDEASQLGAYLAGAAPKMQVLDLCAGAGGKTLALSALMENTGQLYAYDSDRLRFRPIFDRLKRAGARNVQTLPPGEPSALNALLGKMDLVVIDAPCTGTGVWRRRPDAKWRLTEAQLAQRLATQRELFELAGRLARPGGRIAYLTCSILPEENDGQVEAFLRLHSRFSPVDLLSSPAAVAANLLGGLAGRFGITLSPARCGTDGFYIAAVDDRD